MDREAEDESNSIAAMFALDTWNKMMVIAGAAAAVAVTIFLVVCCVGDGCLLHDLITRNKRKKLQERKLSGALYGSGEKAVNLTNYTGPGQTYSRTDTVHLPTRQNSVMSTQSEQSLLSRLTSSRSRPDSSYSSMSSGRTSPSSSLNRSASSVSSTSSPVPAEEKCPPSISFSLLTSLDPDSNTAKLAIGVESCTDLPGRDYGAHCDPWVSVTVNRDQRSLRRLRRPPSPITNFRTKTIRHAHNPFYSQTFVAELQRQELRDLSVVFSVMDQDRHCGSMEIGRANISLKEAKQVVEDPVKFSSVCPLTQTRREAGEILFGLSYLPTAQRLSFSIVKINSIKVDKKIGEETLNPYVRILMFNQSGRLIKKKKTTVQVNTKDPVYNETLNFELAPHHLDTSRFLIGLCSRRPALEMMMEDNAGQQDSSDQDNTFYIDGDKSNRRDSGGKQRDHCLGKIALGKNVPGEKEREHYRSVCETPRQVFSMWHTLALR